MFRSPRKDPDARPPAPAQAEGERKRILLDALADLASTLDLNEVLDRILARSLEVSGAERALVLLGKAESGLLPHRAREASGATIDSDAVAFSTTAVRRALRDGQTVMQELDSDSAALAAGHSVFELKLRSVMCAPMMFRGETLGAIYLDSKVQRKVFDHADRELFEALARQAAIALKNAQLMKEAGERARLARELELAAEIHRDLLPQAAPPVAGLDLVGLAHACEEISGDFYDFVLLPDRRVALLVADVTGHGVGPALLAAEARGEIRALLSQFDDPGRVLTQVHDSLRAYLDSSRFLTLFLAVIEPSAGRLSYANAGHPAALVLQGGQPVWLSITGPPLGVDVEARHASRVLAGLAVGDALLAYSDGLVEARNRRGEVYGEARLAAALAAGSGTAQERAERLLAEAAAFRGGERQDDSTVVLAVWR